jgi:hypothetical protein
MKFLFIGFLLFHEMGFAQIQEASTWPKYAPPGKPVAVPLSADHRYLKDARKTDFWKLIPYYIPQFNEYSCSAATVAIVLNGILRAANPDLKDSDKNIIATDLVPKITTVPWAALVSQKGFNGAHGVTLEQLKDVMQFSLDQLSGKYTATMERFTEKDLSKLRNLLAANEANPNDFIIIHFVQDKLTLAKGGPYPHTSVIGAYDSKRKRVLILDVDRDWYEPYWVSDEDLLKSLMEKTTAFGQGGIVGIAPN